MRTLTTLTELSLEKYQPAQAIGSAIMSLEIEFLLDFWYFSDIAFLIPTTQDREMTAYITYFRVSTQRHGMSGLGLEAQQDAVRRFLRTDDAILETFIEVESGKNCDRPQLAAALAACKRRKATLLIAKLDRLARRVSFISALMDGDVPFVGADTTRMRRA